MQINAGDRIAQLLFPEINWKATLVETTGSTRKHVFWQTMVNDQSPKLMVLKEKVW